MKLLFKFNLILVAVFLVAGSLIAWISWGYLRGQAKREVADQARLMLAMTEAVRDYTSNDVGPKLEKLPEHRSGFIAETVPAFSAVTVFRAVRKFYPDYHYREPALAPTNMKDLPADWERDKIQKLRNNPNLPDDVFERPTMDGLSLTIVTPTRCEKACLECHSIPSRAPRGLINTYGRDNGFGWQEGKVVAARIISVPMSVPLHRAHAAFNELLIFLGISMLVTIAALDAGVYLFVIRPLKLVSATADRVSRGDKNVPPVSLQGNDEIASVAASFNRMQVSLAKALRMIDEG